MRRGKIENNRKTLNITLTSSIYNFRESEITRANKNNTILQETRVRKTRE